MKITLSNRVINHQQQIENNGWSQKIIDTNMYEYVRKSGKCILKSNITYNRSNRLRKFKNESKIGKMKLKKREALYNYN